MRHIAMCNPPHSVPAQRFSHWGADVFYILPGKIDLASKHRRLCELRAPCMAVHRHEEPGGLLRYSHTGHTNQPEKLPSLLTILEKIITTQVDPLRCAPVPSQSCPKVIKPMQSILWQHRHNTGCWVLPRRGSEYIAMKKWRKPMMLHISRHGNPSARLSDRVP